jgi:PAS domain S-box-containing protein
MSSLNDRRLRTLVDAASVVFFTAKPDGRVTEEQASWERFTGQRWPAYRGLGWLDAVFKDDIDQSAALVRSSAARRVTFPLGVRLWHDPTRSFRHVRGLVVPLYDEDGELVEWVISLEDVHEQLMARRRLEETAARLTAVLRNSPVGLALLDLDLRFVLLNEAFARAAGLTVDEHRGRTLADVAPELERHLGHHLRQVLATGEVITGIELKGVVAHAAAGARGWDWGAGPAHDWLVSCYPIAGPDRELSGVGATFADITDRNALQALVQEVSDRDARDRFRSALDAMLDLVSIVRADRDDHGRIVDFRLEHVNHSRPDAAGRTAPDLVGRTMSELYPKFGGSRLFESYVRVTETREPVSVDELVYHDLIDGKPVSRVFAMQISPFEDGLITVSHDITATHTAQNQLREAAARLKRERALVTQLQEALLPEAPALPDLDLAVRYLPAGSESTVGGDWYDVLALDERRVLLAVGDVAGHGLPAAAMMAQLRNALRGIAFAGRPPDEILGTLNDMLLGTAPEEMATCLCGIYDTHQAVFEWAIAGHPPPVLFDRSLHTRLLTEPAGPPLGMPGAVYKTTSAALPAGATLVLYTDGLVEERGRPIDVGLEQLRDVVDALGDRPVEEVCESVAEAMFIGRERTDDVCLVVARPLPRRR